MRDGREVEVVFNGHDGFSGLAIADNRPVNLHTTIAQISDFSYCVNAVRLVQLVEQDARLKQRVLPYAGYSYFASAQFAACNGLHSVEERYAR